MSSTQHFRNECIHGVILDQCRCPAPNKIIHLVACPLDAAHDALVQSLSQQQAAEKGAQSLAESVPAPDEGDDLGSKLERLTDELRALVKDLDEVRKRLTDELRALLKDLDEVRDEIRRKT